MGTKQEAKSLKSIPVNALSLIRRWNFGLMKRPVSVKSRKEIVRSIGDRYRAGTREEKRLILNEFVAVSGYHRKHAIRLLRATKDKILPMQSTRIRRYGKDVAEALLILWEASDRLCGKRLKSLIPSLIESLECHGHLKLDDAVRMNLLKISAATIDRLLVHPRGQGTTRGRRRSRAAAGLRLMVPVRTFSDWENPMPGFMEADLVSHSGPNASGSFAQTLTLTDIASGWTECAALVVRDGSLVVEALTKMRKGFPFPLRGIDTDNGSEFLNETVISYCHESAIEFTRARPSRKNDQAWVEQKNGSVVRRLVGYRRLEGLAAVGALARLYSAARFFVNFFQPSFKLASKTRFGSRVVKRYHTPATPCARLLDSDSIPVEVKNKLRSVSAALDPLRLLNEIRTMQHHLAELASGKGPAPLPIRDSELNRFLNSLPTAWQRGEVRPTHRDIPKPLRSWRTRVDYFEAVWPVIRLWLEAEPDRTAKELFQRIQANQPNTFPDGQLRTLQRRVQEWRATETRRLLLADPEFVPVEEHEISAAIW